MNKAVIAVDLGASSGRIILYEHNSSNSITEIHRFTNYLVDNQNILYWDFKLILSEIFKGLKLAFKKCSSIKSIGINTFGVDFGLLDSKGKLIDSPFSYRNNFGFYSKKIVDEKINSEKLFKLTGIQYMPFNTLYQLVYLKDKGNNLFNNVLLLPDLIAYYLTGEKRTEYTNFSTTNLMHINKHVVIDEVNEFGINANLFPKFIYSGEKYGPLLDKYKKLFKINYDVDVVAVCSHDTASAILSIPNKKGQLFISSGTWSLIGTLLNKPNTTKMAMKYNYSNELGYNNKIRFLKNTMGLWIINEVIKSYQLIDPNINYSYINKQLMQVKPFVSFIDVDDLRFNKPINMVDEIKNYCLETNQEIPNNIFEITMCVYQSLVFKYRKNILELEAITRRKFNKIYLVGGGSNIEVLNQMISSATNKLLVIGNKEATVVGNILIQLKSLNLIENIEKGIQLFNQTNKIYKPNKIKQYDEAYQKYLKIMEMKK